VVPSARLFLFAGKSFELTGELLPLVYLLARPGWRCESGPGWCRGGGPGWDIVRGWSWLARDDGRSGDWGSGLADDVLGGLRGVGLERFGLARFGWNRTDRGLR
jgi:hypothetical protein